jgi:ubiquinone/menaquinone biosynthesis C-methylase UbiE
MPGDFRGRTSGGVPIAEIARFTQPDTAPAPFIELLDILDNHADIKNFRTEAAKRLNLTPVHNVLDVGCGIGGATFQLADLIGSTGRVAGVDISSALIDVARSRAIKRHCLEFHVCDACAIPFPDGFFDAARSERLFLYMPDRLAAIYELKRVVKPGGRVCLIDTDFDCTAIYSDNPALTRKMTSIVAASIPNPNSARDLPALVKKAGLRDTQTEAFAVTTPHEILLRGMTGSLYKAAEDGLVPRAEVDEWIAEQSSINMRGDFFHLWFFVISSGTV